MRIKLLASSLLQGEVWVVGGLVAASMLWAPLLPAAVLSAAFFWLVRPLAHRRLSTRTPADLGILALTLTIPVTLWATTQPETTLYQVYRLLAGIALFYAIVNWCNNPGRLYLLSIGVSLAGLLLALSAPLSVQWPAGKLPFIPLALYEHFVILVSDTVHANVMAGSLVLLIPVALSAILFTWKEIGWVERLSAGLAALSMAGILALTQSRGALMAFAVALLALLLLRWKKGWILLLIAAGLTGVAVYKLGIPTIIELAASSSTIGGVAQREEIWSRAIYMIQDFPFTGIGMGSFLEVVDTLYPFFLSSPGSIFHAHNLFLQLAVDLGLPGLMAWLAILMVVVTVSGKLYRQGRNHKDFRLAGLGAGLLCSQLALVIHGLTDAVTWGMVRPAPIVWAIWGLVAAAGNLYLAPKINKTTKLTD